MSRERLCHNENAESFRLFHSRFLLTSSAEIEYTGRFSECQANGFCRFRGRDFGSHRADLRQYIVSFSLYDRLRRNSAGEVTRPRSGNQIRWCDFDTDRAPLAAVGVLRWELACD